MNTSPTQEREKPYGYDPLVLPQEPDRRELDVREYIGLLLRRRKIFLLCFLIVFTGVLLYTFLRPPVYESTSLIVVAGKLPEASGSEDAFLSSVQALTSDQDVNTQVAVLSADPLLEHAFFAMTKKERQDGFNPKYDDVVPAWTWDVESAKDSSAITVTTKSFDPKLAAKFAANIDKTYLDRDLVQTTLSTRLARVFVENEIKQEEANLKGESQDLALFEHKTNMMSPPDMLAAAYTELVSLRQVQATAQADVYGQAKLETQYQGFIKKLAPEVEALKVITDDPNYMHTRDHLAGLKDAYAQAKQEFAPTSIEVNQILQQIDVDEAKLKAYAQKASQKAVSSVTNARNPSLDPLLQLYAQSVAAETAAQAKLKYATQVLGQANTTLKQYPGQIRDWTELKRKAAETTHILASLIDKYYELLINEKAGIPSAVVSGEPLAPPLPKYPIIPLNLGAGFLMATLIGFAMVLLVERFDSSLHDTTTAQAMSGLPIMAAIPEIQRERRKRGKKAKQELQQTRESLIIGRMQPNPGFLESFRVLRGNLAFASPDRVVKILTITSPSKSEGKSTIAANTAISLAMDGKKVLLIDCDLRRPSVHTQFNVPKEHGLTSVVNGMMTLEEAIRPTEHENLSILTSGPLPPDPSEFLNSRAARAVIAEASKGYDITMLDSPPINGLSDGQVVSTLSDAMLLVASLDSTKKYELLASIRQLRQIHSPLLGLVLNRAKKQRGGYGYYSYYAYYPSYTDYEDDSKDSKKKKRGRNSQEDDTTKVQ